MVLVKLIINLGFPKFDTFTLCCPENPIRQFTIGSIRSNLLFTEKILVVEFFKSVIPSEESAFVS